MVKEKENNNNKVRADQISFDEDVIGSLSSKSDIDVFKFYVDQPMQVTFTLDPPRPSAANKWDVIIKNENDVIFYGKNDMQPNRSDKDGDYIIFNVYEKGWHYIYISQDENSNDNEYSFSLASRNGYFFSEYETNNSAGTATRLRYTDNKLTNVDNVRDNSPEEESWVYGGLYLTPYSDFSKNYDKDYYKFNLQNPFDTIKFTFSTPWDHYSNSGTIFDTDGDEWIVKFYEENDLQNPVAEKTFSPTNKSNKIYEFSVNKSGNYYIKIFQDKFSLVDTSRYKFNLSFSSSGKELDNLDELYGSNIIVPSGNAAPSDFNINNVFNAKEGDDTYILSNALIGAGDFTISDKLGDNVVQLVDGLSFSSSNFYSNILELEFSDNNEVTKVTIENADLVFFEIGGNETSGTKGTKLSYSEFAKELGIDQLPSGNNSKKGNGAKVSNKKLINENSTSSSNNSSNENIYTDKDVTFFTEKFFEEFYDAKWNFGKNIVTITYSFPNDSLRENSRNLSTKLTRQFSDLEKETIEDTINIWGNELNTIQFKFIEDDKNADLTFGFTYIDGKDASRGYFNTTWDDRKIETADIRFEEEDITNIEQLKQISLHEIGNALGLGDIEPTSDFESVMEDPQQPGNYSDSFVLSDFDKAMIRAYYREDTIETYSGTSSDDVKKLSSENDIWIAGPGFDRIDGGSGVDTIIIPDEARIIRSTDVNGRTNYTGIEDKNFLFIRLIDNDGEYSSEYSVLWNFEKIEYRDKTFDIKSFDDNGNFKISSDWETLSIDYSDFTGTDKENLNDYFYTLNEGGSLSYSISSTNDNLKDQISLKDGILTFKAGYAGTDKAGTEGPILTTEITITIKEINSIENQNPAADITEIFSLTMRDIEDLSNSSSDNEYFSIEKNQNGPNIIEFSNSSSNKSGTLNHTSQNDIIVHTGHSGTLRGLGGDDLYILSSLIPKGFNGTIVDTSGKNIIEITDNTLITKIEFAADSMRITIDEDKVLIISGADSFIFRLGANILAGDSSEELTYSQFSSKFINYFTDESYVKSSSLVNLNFNIINISDKNSEIINATDSNDDFRYRFEQISSKGVSLESFTNILIEGFDKNNDKITLVNVNGENLSINEFKDLSGIDISGNSFDNKTVIYFSPDDSGVSGSLEITGIYDKSLEDISLSILSDSNLSSSNDTGFSLANELNSSKPILSSFNSEDSKGTLNLNAYDNIIILTGSYTYRGLDGDDLYFISEMMTDNAKSTIVDSSGNNIIQIPDNTYIDSIAFANDSMRVVLETSKTITINGANEFSYNIGGNITSGDEGETLSYSELALTFGVSDVLNLIDGDAELGTSDIYIV